MLTPSELEAELRALHGLPLRLMPPLNERPHLFHEQKDALARAVAKLMERCGFGVAPSPRAFTSPMTDSGVTAVRQARVGSGREIPVQRRRASVR